MRPALAEPFLDDPPAGHRARFAPARPLRTSVLWCSVVGVGLCVFSFAIALVFNRGVYETQSTAILLAEAAAAVPEVRARWAALHLTLSNFANEAWEEIGGGEDRGRVEAMLGDGDGKGGWQNSTVSDATVEAKVRRALNR